MFDSVVDGVELVVVHGTVADAELPEVLAGLQAESQVVGVPNGHAEHIPTEVRPAVLHLEAHP